MSEASQKTEVGTWGATLGLVKKKVKEAKKKLAGIEQEYERKKLAKEKELQDALSPLEAKLAGLGSEYEKRRQEKEVKLRETLMKQEREGKRRLEKIDTELRAKDAVITEFKKRGLEPTRGLELLKEHENLRGELSKKEGLLESVSSSIEERRKQQRKEESDTASRRETALRMWNATLTEKKRQDSKLDQRIDDKKAREKRLNASLYAIGKAIDTADQTFQERQQQIQEYNQQIPTLKEKVGLVLFAQDKKIEMELNAKEAERVRDKMRGQADEYQKAVEKARRELGEIKRGKEEAVMKVKELAEKEVKEIEKEKEDAVRKAEEMIRAKVREVVLETREEAERRDKLDETLKSEVAKTKGLETNVKDLRVELESTTGELKSLREYKVRFSDGKKLTLAETRKALIEAHNNEIKKRTDEKFQKLKSGYEAGLPRLVHERLIQIINKPNWPAEIANVINIQARARADGILQNKREWPSWFMKFYLNEVSTRLSRELNEEFDRRVDEKSQKIAEEKVERLKTQAWPTWFSQNVKPVIDRSIFKVLKGSWTGWRCDKCGTGFEFTLAEHNIGELLRNGRIEFLCPNFKCMDYGLLGLRSSRHKIKISLESLIARLMKKTEIVPVELVPVKKAVSAA